MEGDNVRCLRCGNEDPSYFYLDETTWYCRKCIAFGRVDVGKEVEVKTYQKRKVNCSYSLKYPLTSLQKEAVSKILSFLKQKKDVLVYAACGAGKTELTMDAIQYYLRQGKKVGFAISRRQVVLEIKERMQQAFSSLRVVAVCEGFTDITDGDLIVCTMHQLYRYPYCFDLLIMDEVDAFPYRDNEMLEAIAMQACIGEKLMLTATPDEKMLKKVEEGTLGLVELFQRPHGYPLIVPQVKCLPFALQICFLIHFLQKQKKRGIQTLVFVPTIALANKLYLGLRLLFKCAVFTSKTEDKEKIIEEFHKKKYSFLLSTTILERGITMKGIYIIILQADHAVFTQASLIQMVGRVGRNIEMPTGEGWFLCAKKTKDIEQCVLAIQKMNETR